MGTRKKISGAPDPLAGIPQLIDQEQLATALGVDVATITNWRRRRKLPPAVRIGRSVRWLATDVVEWIEEHREGVA